MFSLKERMYLSTSPMRSKKMRWCLILKEWLKHSMQLLWISKRGKLIKASRVLPNFQKLPSFINKMNGLNKLKNFQSQKICYSHSLCCKLDHLVLFHFLQFHCNLSHNLNIFKYSYLFYHSLFVHQPGINHAPRALVTQVNYSVHRLSTFLRIHADPSMQIFWISVTAASDTFVHQSLVHVGTICL